MSTTRTVIGEHDVVALLNPVGDWPTGTEGAVVSDQPDYKEVEIVSDHGEYLGSVSVSPEQLRLACKGSDPAVVGELDRVALLSAAEGWGVGTTGTVVAVFTPYATVEISGYLGESLDFLDVPTEQLRLIRKCPRPDLDFARSLAIEGAHKRTAPAVIGELDVVALGAAVDGWPAGTTGAVISDSPTYKTVEISNHLGEGLDYLYLTPEQLRLTRKCPRPAADHAVEQEDSEIAVD